MSIYETYSKRKRKREQAGEPDVYQYDDIPQGLRVQVAQIWQDALGPAIDGSGYTASQPIYNHLHDQIAKEKGVFYLGRYSNDDVDAQCRYFLLTGSTDDALDIIELSFRLIARRETLWGTVMYHEPSVRQSPENAINELNYRFKEHGVGYQFEGGEIVRVDSQYAHAEVVKPAISLLNTAGFKGASDEFLKAHDHYRKGRHGEAMSEALKAFESTMKAICDKNGWSYPGGATAKTLIKSVLDNGLVPKYMETHLSGLRNTLEAGLPTVRNKNSGHGQGVLKRVVPDYFAGYALHLAATNIVFLVEAHESLNTT